MKSYYQFFGAWVVGLAFVGCGRSATPSSPGRGDSDTVRPPQLEPLPNSDSDQKEFPSKTVRTNKTASPLPKSGPVQIAETEQRADLEPAASGAPPAKVAKTKPHPREVLRRKKRGSLPFLMQECGYRWGYAFADDVDAFIKAAIEPARTGSLDGRFLVATTVYRIPTSDRAEREAEAYRLRQFYGPGGKEVQEDRSDTDEIAIQMSLPFRLYKSDSALDRERTKGVKGARSVAVNRAERRPAWFLTADGRLANFAPQQAQMVLARGGKLYCGESRQSILIFRGLDSSPHAGNLRKIPYNDFDPKQEAARSFVCEIEIERLTYGPALDWQTAWGYYRQEALESEELDSDFILHWNSSGALTGVTPDYFRPSDSGNPFVVSAMLVSAILRTKEGEVVASYHRD